MIIILKCDLQPVMCIGSQNLAGWSRPALPELSVIFPADGNTMAIADFLHVCCRPFTLNLPAMPNSASEEPLPPAGEAALAPVSIPVDSVSEVNDQLASTKLSDHDEADAKVGDQEGPYRSPSSIALPVGPAIYDDEAEEVGDDGRPLGTSGFARADAGQLQKRRIIKAGRRFRQARAAAAPAAAAAAPGDNPNSVDARIRRRFKELRKQGVPIKEAMIRASLPKVNEQLASAKLSDQDKADAAVGDTDTTDDPELWKPHPPTEECPVCLVPLLLDIGKSTFWACCGKKVCNACCDEHRRALQVTNRKRGKKKQPPLEKTCAFCRGLIHDNDAELMRRYEKRVKKGDTYAMVYLGVTYMFGKNGVRKNEAKAFELFNRAADLGFADAFGQLGFGTVNEELGSTQNRAKAKEYFEDGARKGDVLSRAALAWILDDEGKHDLAIKHWHLASAAGDDDSVTHLLKCFTKGKLSKPDLERALRAHKAASDEMNSEERERYDACTKALAGNDERLKLIYRSYYAGYTNAKELKAALKAYRAGDWRAVGTLLASKGIKSNV